MQISLDPYTGAIFGDRIRQAREDLLVVAGMNISDGEPVRNQYEEANMKCLGYVTHLCGEVSSTGRVALMSMENYVGVLAQRLQEWLPSGEDQLSWEIICSIALLPGGRLIIDVDTSNHF